MSKKEVPQFRKLFETPEGKRTLNPFSPGKTEDDKIGKPIMNKEILDADGENVWVPMNRKARRILQSSKYKGKHV